MTLEQQTELLVLGACLDEMGTVDFACRSVLPEYFSLESHQRIFARVREMHRRKTPVNVVTLLHELMRLKELEAVGGAAYVTDLPNGVPSGMGPGLREYVDRLKEFHRVRTLKSLAALIDAGQSSADITRQIHATLEMLSENTADSVVFSAFPDFVSSTQTQIDWMVGGIIERGANGFIAAEPKGSKSFCTADLAIALATGTPWLDFSVPTPTRVALVSREDNPSLTAWRLKHLMMGRELDPVQLGYLERNLYVNTRAQTPRFMLDNEQELSELINACRTKKIEFIILDVLNILHQADENDNTQMAGVLRRVKWLAEETGAAIGILHHYKKEDSGRITQRLRGASAIAGFAEWVIGLSMADEEAKIRRMEFELKAGQPPDPIHFCINAQEGMPARIQRIMLQNQPPKQQRAQKGVN
jgi:hypothetical protein